MIIYKLCDKIEFTLGLNEWANINFGRHCSLNLLMKCIAMFVRIYPLFAPNLSIRVYCKSLWSVYCVRKYRLVF